VGVVEIEVIGEDSWRVLQGLRLRALRDAPDMLGPTLDRELGFRESHWRMRLRSSFWFVARGGPDTAPVGLASLIREPGSGDDDRHVVALWVEPAHRREGVGTALMSALADAAIVDRARTLSLWIAEDNDEAIGLCQHGGFAPTGERQRLPRDVNRVEARYEHHLEGAWRQYVAEMS
jgi:ribosomal protein S18 acetylase RimI-like enzyme